MSFPAMEQLEDAISSETGKHIRRGFTRWRVYRFLKPPRLSFVESREEKVATIQHALRMSPNAVVDALDWLTERGYLIEQGRSERGVRRLVLAYELEPRKTA